MIMGAMVPASKYPVIYTCLLYRSYRGVSGMVHEQKKDRRSRIADRGYNNLVFPNHENKQVRCSF